MTHEAGTFVPPIVQIKRQRLREGGQLSKVIVAAQVCVTATPRVGGFNGKTPSEGRAENNRSWCSRVIVRAFYLFLEGHL